MRAIQRYLPNARHTESMRIFVQATPELAWKTARNIDLSSVSWVRFLFDLRTFIDLFHREGAVERYDRRLGIEQITDDGTGFKLLHEEEGKEVVVGAIGKFWHLKIPFASPSPEEFQSFDEPGWGKVAWSISVEPYLDGSTICLELRTTGTDEESWKKLNRYYHVIGLFSNLIRRTGLSRMQKELGGMVLPDDEHRWLPGDEILSGSNFVSTDHINIEAPPSLVWRYLMQMGCDRGGWYSIDFLDNGGVSSTDHLVSKWKDRQRGDQIPANPKRDFFFEVLQVEPEKNYVLGCTDKHGIDIFKTTWAFALEPIGSDATHLVVRAKMIMSQQLKEWIMGNIVYPPVHGLMELVQLRTIKRYAERDAQMREMEKNRETLLEKEFAASMIL